MSTTESGGRNYGPTEITPKYCCSHYFISIMIFVLFPHAYVSFIRSVNSYSKDQCYIELFAHSISVSSAANVSTADWRTSLVAKSPVTGCKLSLHTVTSRLLRGNEVISEASPALNGFGRLVRFQKTDHESATDVDFRNVVTPVVNGSVVWDYRVESIVGLKAESAHGLFSVVCPNIPVKFTVDADGSVFGSLLGGMQPCQYLLRNNFDYV